MTRKTRSDAVLKQLPEELQEQIIEWADVPRSEECRGGHAHAVAMLKAQGIKTTVSRVSDFYTWWQLCRTLDHAEEDSQEAANWMREFQPGDEETARKFGEFVFLQKAVRSQDVRVFCAATAAADSRRKLEERAEANAVSAKLQERAIAQRADVLQLARDKFETEVAKMLLDAALRARAEAIAASSRPHAEKIAAMRQAAFADIDALQASGTVVIPQ